MIIATFGATTGWAGKTITRDGDAFILQDHGSIAAADVMEYDKKGHLLWVDEATRAWVGGIALPSRNPPSPLSARPHAVDTPRPSRSAGTGVKWVSADDQFMQEFSQAIRTLCECSGSLWETERTLRYLFNDQFMRGKRKPKITREARAYLDQLAEEAFALGRANRAAVDICNAHQILVQEAFDRYVETHDYPDPGIVLQEKDGHTYKFLNWHEGGRDFSGYEKAETRVQVHNWFFSVGCSF